MNFTSIEYYIYFLPAVLLSFLIIRRYNNKNNLQVLLLLFSSWIFFWFASGWHIVLLLISTLVDWNAGKYIYKSTSKSIRKKVLIFSLTINLFLLGVFKYLDFLIETFNLVSLEFGHSPSLSSFNLLLPVGISFYTFQTMSYTIDIFQGKCKPYDSFWDFACYAAFFPQLVAGPIVRSEHFRKQIEKGFQFKLVNLKIGLTFILYGLFKKIVIADNIANQVNIIFTNQSDLSNFFVVFYGSFLFGIQIYCDFSAYSTIAIGSAKLFGIDLPQNFNHPFFSKSPEEYWKKWHISLSSWLRDYLYTPIAIKAARNKKSINHILIKSTMVTMLLGGLWHGASWNFVLWGFVHGSVIVIHQKFRNNLLISKFKSSNNFIFNGFSWFSTQLFIIFTWILFRVQETDMLVRCIKTFFFIDCNFNIFEFYTSISDNSGDDFYVGRFFVLGLVFMFVFFHYLSYRLGGLEKYLSRLPNHFWSLIMSFLLVLTILLRPINPIEFIYFRF